MKDRFKRGAAWLTTAVTLASSVFASVPAVSAATVFNDVTGSTSYYQGIMWAYDHGVLQGYGNGNFGPDDCVRRSELAKMIVNYTHTGPDLVGSQGTDPGFYDVSSTAWYYPFVKEAKYKNYLQGYPDGSFRPNNCVNRAEAMKIASNALLPSVGTDSSGSPMMYDNKLVTDVEIFSWYAPFARVMFKNRLMGTDHTTYDSSVSSQAVYAIKFYPAGSMTRKEVAEMLYRISTFTGSTPTPGSTTVGKPVLTLPVNAMVLDTTTTGVNFQFLPATGAASYQLAVKMPGNNDFGWWDITNTSLNSNGYISYFMSKGSGNFLNASGTYYWKIRAWNSTNVSYTDSDTWTLSNPAASNVNITYQAPTLNYNSMPSQINFQWSANVSDSTLVLEYRDPQNISTVAKTVKFTSAAGYSKTLYLNDYQTDFTNYKTFCWKLEKTGTNYLSSTNGYPCVSYTATVLTAPSLVYPANNASFYGSNPQLTVTWSPAQGATRYDLMVLFGGTTAYKMYPVTGSYSTNMSYYVPISDFPSLTQNYTHRWKVRAYDANNNYTESPEWTFNVYMSQAMTSAPTLISPAVETVFHGSQTINFYWTPVTGAVSYKIQIRNSASGSYFFDQTTTNTSYGTYQNAPGTTSSYYWRVVAYDAAGNSMASGERLYLVSPN